MVCLTEMCLLLGSTVHVKGTFNINIINYTFNTRNTLNVVGCFGSVLVCLCSICVFVPWSLIKFNSPVSGLLIRCIQVLSFLSS